MVYISMLTIALIGESMQKHVMVFYMHNVEKSASLCINCLKVCLKGLCTLYLYNGNM